MKKNYSKLLALLFAACLFINGCGDETPPKTNTEQENTKDSTDTDTSADESAADVDFGADTVSDTEDIPANTDIISDTGSLPHDIPVTTDINPDDGNASDTALSQKETASAEPLTGERHSIVGIITDATKYSIAVQTPEGFYYYLTIPETGVTGNLDYITIGQIATLTYVGSLDENHATLVDISDSMLDTGIYVEEYAFAIKIINAVRAMDMAALADLTNFPVFIDTGNAKGPTNTSGEFQGINNEKIFTEALVDRIVNYNLFDLQYTNAGFVMGRGTPSITFDVDDDGILGIIGINSAPAPISQDQ